LYLVINGCSQKEKIDLNDFDDKPGNTWIFETDPTQTEDSIIQFDTKRTIATTGRKIYEITTKGERRRSDSTIPNPFAPVTEGLYYDFYERTLFSITVYDSLGYELTKLFNEEIQPGEYLIKFAIYSVLIPGKYYMKMNAPENKMINKLIITKAFDNNKSK
jgi:hypothetical protein